MDKFEKSDTPGKFPGGRQRSISETEIDLNSPGSEKGKKRSRKSKYLSLWSSKRSLDERFLESSTPTARKSKKGLVRFLSFRKLRKKRYNKNEEEELSPELSEEISLMEEEAASFEGLNEQLKVEEGKISIIELTDEIKKTEGFEDVAEGQVSSNDSRFSPELRNENSGSAQLTEIKLVDEYSSFGKGSRKESRELFSKKLRDPFFFKTTTSTSTSEEEIESDGKEKMDGSSGVIKKTRGRLKTKLKRESIEENVVEKNPLPEVDEISKEKDLERKEKEKEVKYNILSITKEAAGKKELETIRFLESEKKEEEKPSEKTEDGQKTSEIVPGSDVIKGIDKGKGDMAHPEGKREHLYKILVIGELGTGKTSIIKRYVHQFFSQHYRATIGVDFALKVLNWDQNTIIRLQLWDIAGQERFGNMTRVYYKEAVGAFIVFDVTRAATFDAVLKWKQDLDSKVQLSDGSPIPCILLANKCDQPKEGLVNNPSKMDEYCREKGFSTWFETSAKENINIEEAARSLVTKILQNDKLVHNGEQNKDHEKFSLDRRSEKSSSKTCSC